MENREKFIQQSRKAYWNNPEKARADARAHYSKKAKELRAISYAAFREWQYGRWLEKEYGTSLAEFEKKFSTQGSKCAICGSTDPKAKYGKWHQDHSHTGSQVRGVLCYKCNVGLGSFGDSVHNLRRAIAYLNHWNSKKSAEAA